MASNAPSSDVLDHVPVMVRRLNGRIAHWSQGMQRLYSYSAKEALGKISHVLLKTDFPKPLAEIEEEVRDTGRWRGQLAQTRASGESVVVASEWSLLRDGRSKADSILVFNADVTGLSDRLGNLRFIASIVKGSQDAIVSRDLFGIVTSWNPGAEKIFGYSSDEMIAKPLVAVFPADRVQEEEEILSRLRAGQLIDHYETTRLRKDGRQIEVTVTISPIIDDHGKIIGASTVVRDISERKRLQTKLEEVQKELFHVSRLNDMSQMVSGVAHELNQPLAAAASYLAGAKRFIGAGESTRALHGCALASSQITRAGQVIRRLRDFVQRSVSERKIEPLRPLFEEAVSLVLMGTRHSAPRIEYDVPQEASVACVDKIEIQQVVANLARNAIEAMANLPERQLTIQTRPLDARFIKVEVVDTGSGISEDVLEKMFNPFTTTKSNGMGVGLALCRTIVEAHGGSISVSNNRERGTTFQFTLPRS